MADKPITIEVEGPWHSGFVANCDVLGGYVSIIAGTKEAAEAIAEFLQGRPPYLPAVPGTVGRTAFDHKEVKRKRTCDF